MRLKVGAMFAGYGGLEMGLAQVLDVEAAWFAEFDDAPSRILARHWPTVPNLGDVTAVGWSAVEPVDVITGGSPCQDLSHAGKRAGMKAGTRSGLWASMCDAIDIIRPRLVVWENVRGALSAEADSGMEPCPGCVGGGDDGPVLRALGRVLGDLAELGYDAAWHGLRAADVGAPHGRWRVFVLAWPAADAAGLGWERGRLPRERRAGPADSGAGPLRLLPTPRTENNENRQSEGYGGKDGNYYGLINGLSSWGDYAPAIARWEAVLGRPAPAPTEPTGKGGAHRLSPAFVEWMMGLPAGWTDVPGVTRNHRLKALGNGVVPQQCAAAVRHLLDVRANVLEGAAA